MMEAAIPRSWKEQFAIAAAMREEDVKHREKMARFDARQRTMREDERIRTEKREREAFDSFRATFATERQITEFRVKLDRTDEKTVEALMENGAALDEVRDRLDRMLGQAHVMPDGRRVFRTMNGNQVFDEHGTELARDEIDPDTIGDSRPKWEEWKAEKDAEKSLLQERQELLDYQARIDAARETIDKDGVTTNELDDLDADLNAAMPEAVRRKLGSEGPTRNAEAAPSEPSNGVRVGATLNDPRPATFSPI